MTDTRSGLYEKALFKAQSHTRLCKSPNSDGKGLANVTESRGSTNLCDLKKHHITRNWGDPVNSQGYNIPLVLKNTIFGGSMGDPVNGWGQNIPLVTDIRTGLYEKAILKAQSCTSLCKSPNSDKLRQFTRKKTWYSQNFEKVTGGFHQPLGVEFTMLLWITNRWSRLYNKTLFKHQSHTCLCKLPNSDGAGNLHGRRPGKAKILLSQGVSKISRIKKHYVKRKPGDLVNGQGHNFPMVTDTGSGLYNKVFFKAQSFMYWCTVNFF